MSDVRVLPVPKGSIIWLHDVNLGDGANEALELLRKAIGHNQFAVVHTNGNGIIDVLGPDELVARVRAALDPKQTRTSTETWQGLAHYYDPTDEGICKRCELPADAGVHAEGRR